MIFLRYESFRSYLRLYPVTSALLAVLIGVHLADQLTGRALSARGVFLLLPEENPYGLIQPWRYVTSMLLHGDWMHLLYNCFSLLVFAPPLERLLGHVRYLVFFLLCGVLGNVLSMLMFQASADPYHAAVGASGGIYGVFGAYLYLAVFRKDRLDEGSRKTVYSILIFGLIYTFLSPRVDVWGHIGGALAGLLLLMPFSPRRVSGYGGGRWN